MKLSMCDNCSSLAQTVEIRSADDFRDRVDQARSDVDSRKLTFESGNVALNSIQRGHPFPDDVIELIFACPHCHMRFSLGGVVYSGRNVKWSPL